MGFLADVRRMNVALTRAKHFLFVIAGCESNMVNPYWRDLVQHARETKAVVSVSSTNGFGDPSGWPLEQVAPAKPPPQKRHQHCRSATPESETMHRRVDERFSFRFMDAAAS